jgi:hypothetical protein
VVLSASRLGSHGKLKGTLEDAVAEIEAHGGRAAAVAADLSDAAARGGLFSRAEEAFGPIDILVNNAAGARMKLPSQATLEDRNFMFELNVNAPVDLAQQAILSMRARGGGRAGGDGDGDGGGWILNISSATSFQPALPYRDSQTAALVIGPYGATKAALDRYTLALAHEVAEDEIFVNALAPTAIVLTQGADYVREIGRRNPDMVEPVEMMAEAALELCTGRHVGRVTFSRDIVHAVGRKVRSLDGKKILGNAFMEADIEATA